MILTGDQGPTAVVTSTTILVPQTITEARPANLIPAGEVWEFDPDVSTTLTLVGNLVVEGTLRMRPSGPDVEHVIRFVGVDESRFVGGGMDVLDTDVGLWVMGDGVLDLAAHPRERWNRTGTSPTWLPDDELVIAPNRVGDYEFRPFTAGDRVPYVTDLAGAAYFTEVLNLTSNVRIEGTETGRSHLFIRSTQPQRIDHVGLRWMGPRQPDPDGGLMPVLGRYPVHFHHSDDGSDGSSVLGTIVCDSTRAFVPHGAHGITFEDCIAYRITDDAYWWDLGHLSHRITWRHCFGGVIARVPATRGKTTAFFLGNGDDNVVEDCAAAVVRGFEDCSGFHWPEMAGLGEHSVWTARRNAAHNIDGCGAFIWQNDGEPHVVDDFVAYCNVFGVKHGAYGNRYEWHRPRLFGSSKADLRHMAIPKTDRPAGQVWTDVMAETLTIGEHAKGRDRNNTYPIVLENLRCRRVKINESPTPGSGSYVLVTAPGWPLTQADVEILARKSRVEVRNADGSGFLLP